MAAGIFGWPQAGFARLLGMFFAAGRVLSTARRFDAA